MKIVLFGSDGQLGSAFKDFFDLDSIFYGRDVDILDFNKLNNILVKERADIVINCVAYTDVDKAESDRLNCSLVNIEGVKNLVDLQKKFNFLLINFSTDFIYNTEKNTPHSEDSPKKPLNYYGLSKLEGEKLVETCKKFINFRISWLYYHKGRNFVKTILGLAKDERRNFLTVVYDQVGTPTNCKTVVKAVSHILKSFDIEDSSIYGNYNLSDEGVASWYDFAKAILEYGNISKKIVPVGSDQFKTDAKRPSFSVMSKSKISKKFNLDLPHWRDSLKSSIGDFE